MTVVRQDLGVNFPGVGETPLRSGKSPAQLYLAPALLIAAMLVGILLSFQSHDLSYRLQIVGLSLALGCLGAALLAWELSVSVGVVRLVNQSPSLRFTYAPSLDLLYPLAAAIMVLPAILALIARLRGEAVADIGFGRRTVEVLGILGVVLLAQQLWALRAPRGLELTSEGVRGVRGAGRIVLSWDDLGAASAMSTRTGAKLGLRVTSGETYILPRRLIGSDPDAVAAIINYYLRHPADRHHLAQPEFAIRLVAQGS
ncbi:hypothetical protein ACFWHR_04765 [Leucobacter sp. NPDC058333]|uniref:hypothetical protein n=1 Tax=Leucobacter sp. NPDC058333 TaxID=3346450 RepID=UPI003658B57D